MLATEKVNQFYGGSHTLWDIDLDVPAGDCVCLMGRNGVGKTTLLKVIMGLLPATSGKVRFDDAELTGGRRRRGPGPGIGFVPQGREIFPSLTVEENLRMVARPARRRGARDARARADAVPGAQGRCCAGAAAICRAASSSSSRWGARWRSTRSCSILDEPTEGIQPNIVHEIGDVIVRLAEEGVTVLLVEQKLAFARRVARSFCILDRGRTVAPATIAELTDDLVRRHLTV